MERLKQRLATTRRVLAALESALDATPPSELERDGCIQRFEYIFESFWKLCQRYLAVVEGLDCASPKWCLRGMGEDLERALADARVRTLRREKPRRSAGRQRDRLPLSVLPAGHSCAVSRAPILFLT